MAENKQLDPVFEGVDLGVGTWAWGDRFYWGYQQGYQDADIQAAFDASVSAGVRLFDTAEVYGQGVSEILLGRFIQNSSAVLRVATKFMPFPWRLTRGSLLKALDGSRKRLGIAKVDLYQIHMPSPPVKIETWMDAMVEAYQKGWIGAIGVSNYDQAFTERAFDSLHREGIQLASNQVEYNLMNRKIEQNGLMMACQEKGIAVIAYSPLGMGLLTGKYTPENAPRGLRARKYGVDLLKKAQPLITMLKKIGSDHGGKTAGQVSLNWIICKGAIPIPGAKTLQQAEQNIASSGWRLTSDEINLLDDLSGRLNRLV
jgi:aryl-alcohol dehydrogenase-like predicted oxidoreductase